MIYYSARKKFFYPQFLLCILLFSGCISYKYSVESYHETPLKPLDLEEQKLYDDYQQSAATHWLYHIIPRHRNQIQWYDLGHWLTWALLGNDDVGIFAEAHLPLFEPKLSVGIVKALSWMVRNPFHNFCYYVIGSADYQNDELTVLKINRKQFIFLKYNPIANTVFGGRYSSFYLGFHRGKPLLSLRIAYGLKWKSDFYIGWRDKGNFGIKILPLTKNSLAIWENLQYED